MPHVYWAGISLLRALSLEIVKGGGGGGEIRKSYNDVRGGVVALGTI